LGRLILGFISGIMVCGMLLFTVRLVVPTRADQIPEDPSDNSSGLSALIPDIEGIYRESLYMPFEKAANKIYDPDIAEYYSELISRAGLKAPPTNAP
jgi:hypothetical protein